MSEESLTMTKVVQDCCQMKYLNALSLVMALFTNVRIGWEAVQGINTLA
jgi:hypothetical protein